MIKINYDYIPKLNKINFQRKERDGSYTIRGVHNFVYLNNFTTMIYDYVRKQYSILDIIKTLAGEYTDTNVEYLLETITTEIAFLENNGIISEGNWMKFEKGNIVVSEKTIKLASNFALELFDTQEPKFISINFNKNRNFFSTYNIRKNIFNSQYSFF